MKPVEQWLLEYRNDHRNSTNQVLHKICVPAIVFSLFGLLFTIPFPLAAVQGLDRLYMNWGAVFAFFVMSFYLRIIPRFAFPLLVLILCILGTLTVWEGQSPRSILPVSIGIFVLAWVGQFIGHKIEGKKPSFFKDLQFLLIGPIWVLASVLDVRIGSDKKTLRT